jgi:hypothetical protein
VRKVYNLLRHLQNPGGAASSLPVRRQIAGSEDAAPPMHEVLQAPLQTVSLRYSLRNSQTLYRQKFYCEGFGQLPYANIATA